MGGRTPIPLITDAQSGTSKDLAARQRHYLITMTFRLLCFVSMIFVPGWFRWVLLAAAIFLPYIAVIFANQPDDRGPVTRTVEPGEPVPAPALHAGPIIIGQPDGPDAGADHDPSHGPANDDSTKAASSRRGEAAAGAGNSANKGHRSGKDAAS